MITMAVAVPVALVGCEGDPATPPPKAFEIEGNWLFLGPTTETHDLTIGHGSMAYTEPDGKWSSNWTIKAYDNTLHHFQITFGSGSGTYLPVGQSFSGTYDVGGFLTIQLANGLASYPPLQAPGTCTVGPDVVPDCRLYVKQN
jgi:hypothetical protein